MHRCLPMGDRDKELVEGNEGQNVVEIAINDNNDKEEDDDNDNENLLDNELIVPEMLAHKSRIGGSAKKAATPQTP